MVSLGKRRGDLRQGLGFDPAQRGPHPEYVGTLTRLIGMENISVGVTLRLSPPKSQTECLHHNGSVRGISMGRALRPTLVILGGVRLRITDRNHVTYPARGQAQHLKYRRVIVHLHKSQGLPVLS
jgi:hypothetical protein